MMKLLKLLKAYKKELRRPLVFIGSANLAKYYWCGMKSYYTSLDKELEIFSTIIMDRLQYFKYKKHKVDNIDLTMVKTLLRIKPSTAESFYENRRFHDGMMDRGNTLQSDCLKNKKTIRWAFPKSSYYLLAQPDAITKKTVYEFKTNGNSKFTWVVKPVINAQADIYGSLFNRKYKHTIIYNGYTGRTVNQRMLVDKSTLKSLIKNYKNIENGHYPKKPLEWKCNNCQYIAKCIYKKKSPIKIL